MLMAKGINSGYLPLGAVMFSAAIGEKFLKHSLPLLHGSTYNGHPVCCASAIANIGILKRERLVERSAKMGHYFGVALDRLRELDIVAGIRGLGLMQAVILRQSDGKSAEPLQVLGTSKKIQAAGVLAYPMPSACGLCPPLNVSRSDIDLIVERLHAALSTLRLGNGAVHSIDPSTLAGNDVRLAAPHRA
jgi:adenosylmethionine-8-amino-7-oxononanoate aminotransferase